MNHSFHRSHLLLSIAATWVTLAACSPPPQVRAVKAAKTRVETTVTTTSSGTVEAEQQAVLGFTAPGRIARINVTEGSRVKGGQVLAELEHMDLQTIHQDAVREMRRARELFAAGLVSQAALDDARKNQEISRANLGKAIIRAPFDGLVTEVNLEVGELANAGAGAAPAKPPIRLIDLKPRIVKGAVDEVDLSKVRVGAPTRIRIPAARPEPFAATVSRVVPYVSTVKEQDRTSQVEFRFTEPDDSVPVGASADIEIVTRAKDNALAVPSRTLLGAGTPGNQRYVFRVEDGRLRKATVQAGLGNYERTEIVSGLQEGDIVVFPSDEVELKDGQKVKAEIAPWP